MFVRKYKEKQFCCGYKILTEAVFVTQLCSIEGISVWRIVWVTTNCCFMSDIKTQFGRPWRRRLPDRFRGRWKNNAMRIYEYVPNQRTHMWPDFVTTVTNLKHLVYSKDCFSWRRSLLQGASERLRTLLLHDDGCTTRGCVLVQAGVAGHMKET